MAHVGARWHATFGGRLAAERCYQPHIDDAPQHRSVVIGAIAQRKRVDRRPTGNARRARHEDRAFHSRTRTT